jgi:acetyl esterase/lipase
VFAISLAGISASVGAQAPRSEPELRKDLVFAVREEKSLKLDVYRPRRQGRLPAVLIFHGGGWYMGGRASGEAPMFARRLAEAGYVAISASYRLSQEAVWPAQLADVRRAAQYVRHHAAALGVDADRLAALGASAGGHLAAFLAVGDDAADPTAEDPLLRHSTRVRCAVSVCGPMDFAVRTGETKAGAATVVKLLTGRASASPEAIAPLLGEPLRAASPAAFVDPHDPPVFLAYGDRDGLVHPAQTFAMAEALKTAQVPHVVHLVPGGGHCDFLGRLNDPAAARKDPLWSAVLEFLVRNMTERRDRGPASQPTSRPASRPAAPSPATPESRPASRPAAAPKSGPARSRDR